MKYITLRSNTYYYRRIIPSKISHLSDVNRIYRPLSKDKNLAMKIAKRYDDLFNMIDLSIKLNESIYKYLDELDLRNRRTTVDIYDQYLNNQDVSDTRRNKIERLLSVIRVLLPKDLKRLNMSVLDDIRNTIVHLPKRNIQKYRVMKIEDLVKLKVPTKDKLTTETVNSHLKILNSLLKFTYERDLIPKQYSVSMIKSTVAARDQRQVLNDKDILNLLDTDNAALRSSYKISYYSGLRLSEIYKCKLTTVDGIKCFDLTDKNLGLKTQSSYRMVPVHKDLLEDIEDLLEEARSVTDGFVSRSASKTLDTKGKTLYSLRHTFATRLASSNVETNVLSELLGHSHSGMTMGRYVKGFDTELLSTAVNNLQAIA